MAISGANGQFILGGISLVSDKTFDFTCNYYDWFGYWSAWDVFNELSNGNRIFVYLDTLSNPIDGKAIVVQLEIKTINVSTVLYNGDTGYWYFEGTLDYLSGGDVPDLSAFAGSNTMGILAEGSQNLGLSFLPEAIAQNIYGNASLTEIARNIDLYTKIDSGRFLATGIQGLTGVFGIDGATGIQGSTGIAGIDGVTGIQGVTGILGIDGVTGIQGVTGLAGIQGLTGIQGFTGIQGSTGLIDPSTTWLYAVNPSGINSATETSYFGTKSGDFDVDFYRNNEKIVALEKNNLAVYSDKLEFKGSNPPSIEAQSLTISSSSNLKLEGVEILSNAKTITKTYKTELGVSLVTASEAIIDVPVLDGDTSAVASYTSIYSGLSRKIKSEIFFYSSDKECCLEKISHIGRDNVLKLTQDSFTSNYPARIGCNLTFASDVLDISLNNLSGINKTFRVLFTETASL